MEPLAKLMLFLSYSSTAIERYQPALLNKAEVGIANHTYKENIAKATLLHSFSLTKTEYYYNKLDWNPKTIEETITLESKLYFLATSTFERYYLNPLTIKDTIVATKSLGDLLFTFDGVLISFNDILQKKGYSDDYKSRVIEERVGEFKNELISFISEPLKDLAKDKKAAKSVMRYKVFFETCFFTLVNIALFLVLYLDKYHNVVIEGPQPRLYSVVIWLFLICIIIYDMIFLVYKLVGRLLSESLYYTKRFFRMKKDKVYMMVEHKCLALFNYYKIALRSKRSLHDDIYKFAKFGDDRIDLDSIRNIKKRFETKSFLILSAIHNSALGIAFISLIALIIVTIYAVITVKGPII